MQQSKYRSYLMPTITTCEPANDDQQATCQADIVSSDNQPDNLLISPDCGRKITFDNHDDRQEVHYMTEDHQNIDEHVVTFMASENIIPAYSLSDKVPENGVLQMDNGECLPNHNENIKQRENYIVLVERIITHNIPCLKYLGDVTTSYIPHHYREEVHKKTDTVCILINTVLMT